MNVELAKRCCRACVYGYDRMIGVDPNPGVVAASAERFIVNGTSSALVLEYTDQRVIVFPGTQSEWDLFERPRNTWESVKDWLRNLTFRLMKDDGQYGLKGRQHAGFLAELKRVTPTLCAELEARRVLYGDKPLIVTGHSQGGAIAAIATAALPLVGFPVKETVTFGAPRPGDRPFAESLAGATLWRFEAGNDIVPHLPFRPDVPLLDLSREALDFCSVGQLVYGRKNNATVIVTDSAGITHEQRLRRLALYRDDWIEHHHLEPSYFSVLEALL